MTPARETRGRKRIEDGRHHQRHAHVGIVRQIHSVKSRRRYTENGERCFIDEDRLVDDVWIFVESSFPERIAQHRDGMRAWCAIVVLSKKSSGPRTNSEHFEKVSTHQFAENTLCLI